MKIFIVAYLSLVFSSSTSAAAGIPDSKAEVAAASGLSEMLSADVDQKSAFEIQSGGDSDVQAAVVTEEPVPAIHLDEGVAWTAPDYSNQENALGYKAEEFQVSEGLKERVQFWVDIYTKYTSSQGVLHDGDNINIVYETIDFSAITNNPAFTDRDKYRLRKKMVNDAKKDIVARLKKLQKVKSAEELEGDDLRYWNLFEKVTEKNKFAEAAKKNRLRFQLGQRDFFTKGVYYSGRYLKEMEKIFREEGVPVQLTRLPFVESSFNIYARSKVGASGIWQFMRGTGKRYMKVGYVVDERNDPLVATRSAARMLKQNYQLLETWPLAITAYNHGPSGVARVAKKCNSKDICDLIERGEARRFGFASKNFFASFLAAVEVEGHASQYLGAVKRAPEITYETAQLIKPMNFRTLLRVFDGNQELTELYNPHFTQSVRNGYVAMPRGAVVRVPSHKSEALMAVMNSNERVPAMVVNEKETTYRVLAGDTLSGISTMFGVPVRRIIEVNDVDPRRLRPGQKLVIPVAKD